MIAQSLPQKHYRTNNYKSLAAYVLRIPTAALAQVVEGHRNEAVAWARAINSTSPYLDKAIRETDMVQRMNKRAEACKSYHYVISFPAGETPSRDVLENIEEVLSSAIGYGAHQRLMAVHQDKPNLHMHVVINRVHPETFKCVGTAFDHYILQRTAAELEDVHGLLKDSHMPGSRIRDREPFRPPQPQPKPVSKRDPDLAAAFRLARDESARLRKQALQALRTKHHAYFKKLVEWHKTRRTNAAKQRLGRADRKSTSLVLREAAQNDHAARKQRAAWEREQVKNQHPILTWEAFNEQQIEHEARAISERLRAGRALHFSEDRAKRGPVPARQR